MYIKLHITAICLLWSLVCVGDSEYLEVNRDYFKYKKDLVLAFFFGLGEISLRRGKMTCLTVSCSCFVFLGIHHLFVEYLISVSSVIVKSHREKTGSFNCKLLFRSA